MLTPSPRPAAITRAQIIAAARDWLGTPYHHQASTRGVGVDCVGVVRGVWRTLYGTEATVFPAYTRDWAEATGIETLLDTARIHLVEVARETARPGDILVFRFRPHAIAKHTALLVTPATFIHALEGATVREAPLSNWWRRRIAGTFSFPGIID